MGLSPLSRTGEYILRDCGFVLQDLVDLNGLAVFRVSLEVVEEQFQELMAEEGKKRVGEERVA